MESRLSDPLADFRFRNQMQRDMFTHVRNRNEVYSRCSNFAGKTTGGAALGVAISRGLHELDGIELPRVPMPAVGWAGMRSYKEGGDSVLKAYRKWIGDWPHHVVWEKKGEVASSIWVRPDNWHSDNWTTWSKIVLASADSGDIGRGARLDWVHWDEPPPELIWREMRMRIQDGRELYLWATVTPLKRAEWWWIEEDYKDCKDNEPHKGRVRLTLSIYESGASKEQIAKLERDTEGDPHRRARLYGIPVDASGTCPFPYETIETWRSRCRPPKVEPVIIQSKADTPGGRTRPSISLPVERWCEHDERDAYYATYDLASGTKSPTHDPLGMHIWSWRRKALVERYVGYVHPYGLGWLAGIKGQQWASPGHPMIHDPERNGGWIDAFLEGLRDSAKELGYVPRLAHESFQSRPGVWEKRPGHTLNEKTRDHAIAALLTATHRDDIGLWSEEVVSCLANCVENDKGKIEAGPGYHDEDLMCAGQFLYVAGHRQPAPIRPPRESASAERFRKMVGIDRTTRKLPLGVGGGGESWGNL